MGIVQGNSTSQAHALYNNSSPMYGIDRTTLSGGNYTPNLANVDVNGSVLVTATITTGNITANIPANATIDLERVGNVSITLGQKAMVASLPVVLASDQASIPVTISSGNITFPGNLTINLDQVGGAAISLAQKTMANSLPVVIASDQSPVPMSGNISIVGNITLGNSTNNIGNVTQGTVPWVVSGNLTSSGNVTVIGTPSSATSLTSGTIFVDTTANGIVVLPNEATRKGFIIVNNGNVTGGTAPTGPLVYWNTGNVSASTGNSATGGGVITPGGSISSEGLNGYTGPVNVIAASGNTTVFRNSW